MVNHHQIGPGSRRPANRRQRGIHRRDNFADLPAVLHLQAIASPIIVPVALRGHPSLALSNKGWEGDSLHGSQKTSLSPGNKESKERVLLMGRGNLVTLLTGSGRLKQ